MIRILWTSTTAAALSILALQADAQLVPGNVPEDLVGDWQCGETRLYITKLGSIERLGPGYDAGLFRGVDAGIEIEWENGVRTIWSHEAIAGASLTLTTDDGSTFDCAPRE